MTNPTFYATVNKSNNAYCLYDRNGIILSNNCPFLKEMAIVSVDFINNIFSNHAITSGVKLNGAIWIKN